MSTEPETIDLPVRGLHCAGCVARLTKLIERVPGVERAEVSLADGAAYVRSKPGIVLERAAIVRVIEDAGFYV